MLWHRGGVQPPGIKLHVELTTVADNIASQRVIEANGGELVERFYADAHGGEETLRFRIVLG